MPREDALPNWAGQDVFIIGGGPSLRGFEFEQLSKRAVIGCNHAFALGPVCQICTFGDIRFWDYRRYELEKFEGWVVTNNNSCLRPPPPWLKFYGHKAEGLAPVESGDLAWNNNTGALAINLALVLG